jgi:flagellar basal body P-ring formation protein FlgA
MRALILVLATAGPAVADSVVALNTIAAGTTIMAEDLVIVPDDLPGAVARVDEAAGMTASGMIYAGQAVRRADLVQPAVVARNALVTLIYAAGPLRIETQGRALDAAPGGGLVRVMNLGSRNIVTGTVTGPGTVTIGETG